MIAVFTVPAANVKAQQQHKEAAARTQAATSVDPCRISAESPTCLKSRIDRLAAAIANLEEKLNQLERSSQSSGDTKGDDSTNLWKEINRIKQRLNM
jgi:hypothetical protein